MSPERPAKSAARPAERAAQNTLVGWLFPPSPDRDVARAACGMPADAFFVGFNSFPGPLHQPAEIVPLMKAIACAERPICLYLASDSPQTLDMNARRWAQHGLPASRFCGVKRAHQDWTTANITVSNLAALYVRRQYAGRSALQTLAQASTQDIVAAVLAAPGADGGQIVFIRDSSDVPGLAGALAQLFDETLLSAI